MKIIVTGGSGFLGTHMIEALVKKGHSVKNIDLRPPKENNLNFETVIADVKDTEKMIQEIKDAQVVFHFAGLIEAGESVKFPQKFTDTNVSGTISVLEAMRVNGIKTIIFSSSAAIYGEPKHIPIKEDDPTLPISPYGMTKLAMEGLISSYVYSHGFSGVALRYFNLYGPKEHHEPETHAMPRFIKQIYENKELTIYGNGAHQRDYVHVLDIVDAHLKALDFVIKNPNKYHYFNLSTQKPSSVLEIAKIVEKVMNKKGKYLYMPERPGDPLVLYADATKAREILKWSPTRNLQEGVRETVEYFVSYWKEGSE